MDDRPLPPLTAARAVTSWRDDPVLVVLLVLAAMLYLLRAARVARRRPGGRWPRWRTVSFLAGLLVIDVAIQGGVGVYAHTLFWIHMVQHLLLIMVAPALLAAGWPGVLLLHASRNPTHARLKRIFRSRPVTVATCPLVTLPAYAATLVGTHLTGFMATAMDNRLAAAGEHLLYLAVGYALLLPVFGAEPIRWRLSHPARQFLLLLTMPIDTFTGLILFQTSHPLYPALHQHRGWGPDQIQDLQWAGATMWIGGDGLMLGLMLLAAIPWVRSAQRAPSRRGWLERARLVTLHDHTGQPDPPEPAGTRLSPDDPDEDQQLAAYNAWLQRLHDNPPSRRAARDHRRGG